GERMAGDRLLGGARLGDGLLDALTSMLADRAVCAIERQQLTDPYRLGRRLGPAVEGDEREKQRYPTPDAHDDLLADSVRIIFALAQMDPRSFGSPCEFRARMAASTPAAYPGRSKRKATVPRPGE